MESKNQSNNIKCKKFEIFNHKIKDTKVIYAIEIILTNNQSIIINERYSELLNLHNLMSKEAKLPPFPQKKYFGNTDELFLVQRQNNLNSYYNTIISNDKFVNLPSFKSWLKSKFNEANIKEKEKLDYHEIKDIRSETERQEMLENEIKENIIPLFIDMEEKKNIPNKNHEIEYYNLIKSELFPFVENDPYSNNIEGNNMNFNHIGSKKNNYSKIEKLFNNKLMDINKKINTECFDNYSNTTTDLVFNFDI